MERQALAMGSHAHVLVFQSLVYLYGVSLWGVCRRSRVLDETEIPDLEPVLTRLPRDMRDAILGAIRAEQAGHCVHETPTRWGMNFLESRYIWAYEEHPNCNN